MIWFMPNSQSNLGPRNAHRRECPYLVLEEIQKYLSKCPYAYRMGLLCTSELNLKCFVAPLFAYFHFLWCEGSGNTFSGTHFDLYWPLHIKGIPCFSPFTFSTKYSPALTMSPGSKLYFVTNCVMLLKRIPWAFFHFWIYDKLALMLLTWLCSLLNS